jgi:predicted outer membrane lipoprotein
VYEAPIAINDSSATSYQFAGLDNGISYDIKVVTITSSGATEFTGNTAEVFEMPRTVPTPPRDLTIAAPTGRIARVSWRIPQSDGGSVITSYVVNAQDHTCTFEAATEVVCEITGLTPGSPLSVDVHAVNEVGQSLAASVSMNLPNRPTPPSMRSVVINSTSALVTWLPPTSDGGQSLLGYLVYVTETSSSVTTSALIASEEQCSTLLTNCQIDGLDLSKKYSFSVRAVNAVGQSDPSALLNPFETEVVTSVPVTSSPAEPASPSTTDQPTPTPTPTPTTIPETTVNSSIKIRPTGSGKSPSVVKVPNVARPSTSGVERPTSTSPTTSTIPRDTTTVGVRQPESSDSATGDLTLFALVAAFGIIFAMWLVFLLWRRRRDDE